MSFQRYTTGIALITHLITHWVIVMDTRLHDEILAWKTKGEEPNNYPSTRSNWLALSKKYEVKSGRLFRNSKPVLLDHELDDTWRDLHGWLIYALQNKLFSRFDFVMRHSGANLSWKKVNAVTNSYLLPIKTQNYFSWEVLFLWRGKVLPRTMQNVHSLRLQKWYYLVCSSDSPSAHSSRAEAFLACTFGHFWPPSEEQQWK